MREKGREEMIPNVMFCEMREMERGESGWVTVR
jgi:hypothetical protein